ncbi:purine-cytosine permease family protein [Pseudonocardia acidicola]|uniref:Thiamine permease n=1 Tax=Pseudonocardia acidicola TaxID=2724939 RepID=A0ABX1SKC3_9PSEU|nr:thiamine permease [Pseudonocardia acidicola]NMI00993.1 thiamine permease [Pseudonocardia acidicola]
MTELASDASAGKPAPAAIPPLDISFVDDPRVQKEAAAEDYSVHVMPRTWRSGRTSLLMAFGSMFSAMFWLYVAATVAAVAGTVNAVIGIVLTGLTKGAMNFVLSRYASRSGLTVALLSRRIFGYAGSILAPLIFAATALYYGVFEGSIVAVALQSFVGGGDIRLWYLLVVAYSVPLILGGVRTWLDKLNGVLLPFYVAGLIALVAVASSSHPASIALPDMHTDLAGPGWLWAFSVYMGVYILMMYTVDFARFGKAKDETFHGIVTFGPVFYLLTYLGTGLVGIFLTATIPGVLGTAGITETGIVEAVIGTLGLAGLLLIVISQTRINSANLYLASTNLEALTSRVFRVRLPRIVWAVVAGVLVYALMLTDVLSYLLRALSWQGVFVVAWVAIALTHIALHRRTEGAAPEFRPGRLRRVTPAAAVWVVVSLIGILLVELTGPFGATWSAPITFILSAAGYALVYRFDALLHRPSDPRAEVADAWEARIRCHVCDRSYTAVEMDRDPSAGHEAICAGCATASPSFYRAARIEAASTHIPTPQQAV